MIQNQGQIFSKKIVFRTIFSILFLIFFQQPIDAQIFPSSTGELQVNSLAKNLEHPWALDFLPNGNMLVSERPGRLRIVSKNGEVSPPLAGVPAVYAKGQGGLLDIRLDPKFRENKTLYFCYAEGDDIQAGTAVAKAQLYENKLQNVRILFRQRPKVSGANHWGCRIVFAPDQTLFVTLGERFNYSDKAQDLTNDLGKIVHITTEGKPAADNPFINRENVLPEIWSYGHRNIQGATLDPVTQKLWVVEHGPRGGDEVNVIEAGKNYGWPEASYGSHYSLLPIPDEHAKQGFIEPIYFWNPSVSPSGLLFYSGNQFPKWKGDLFIGALSGQALIHLVLKNGKILKEERLLKELKQRIRDVREGPDGYIYILTDSDNGQILQIKMGDESPGRDKP